MKQASSSAITNMSSLQQQQQQHQYGGPQSVFCKPVSHRSPKDEEDTEALAGFLLSLKHRSVTPEPQLPISLSSSSNETVLPSRSTSDESSSSSIPTESTSTPIRAQSPFENLTAAVSMSSTETPSVSQAASQDSSSSTPSSPSPTPPSSSSIIDLEALLDKSKLVAMKDRDLVPDALFAAMAQMEPCRLQHADRVGCYKSRDLGFVGFRCKHCGGQPGFGRYFPNSVRSLAQTTTSQTILKHIGGKCRFCPADVRENILELQRQQAARESLPTGRPRYGSRKIFFQRVWQRLHGPEVEKDLDSNAMNSTPSSDEEETPRATISANSSKVSVEEMAALQSELEDEVCTAALGKRRVSIESGDLPMSSTKRPKLDVYPTQVSTV